MSVTINILVGLYAVLKLPIRALLYLGLGLRWFGKNFIYLLMQFIKHALPLITLAAAWYFLLVGFWWLVLSDHQVQTGAHWFAGFLSLAFTSFFGVGLFRLGENWRKGKVHW